MTTLVLADHEIRLFIVQSNGRQIRVRESLRDCRNRVYRESLFESQKGRFASLRAEAMLTAADIQLPYRAILLPGALCIDRGEPPAIPGATLSRVLS